MNQGFTMNSAARDHIMIGLQSIEKVYRTDRIETVALTNVNLDVREGEFISIMGPSGCGKSTLLNLMGLLDVPSKGKVQITARRSTTTPIARSPRSATARSASSSRRST